MIEYEGYVGVVQYDADLDTFHGTVVNTQDVISFYGSSVEELHAEMRRSVEAYLDFCEEQGRPPRDQRRSRSLDRRERPGYLERRPGSARDRPVARMGQHRAELADAWTLARKHEPLDPIEPLR